MTLEEVIRFLKSITNDLSMVKQTQATYSFARLAPQLHNQEIWGQDLCIRPPNVLSR